MIPETAPALSFERLEALHERWVRAGMEGLLAHLEPGLPDAQIDELTAPLGLRLPVELRMWFAWHNGGARYPWTLSNALWSLEDAVEETQFFRDVARSVREDPDVPEVGEWQSTWFAFTGLDGGALVVDAAEQGTVSPVLSWKHGVVDRVPSVGRAAQIMIEAYDSDYVVSAEDGFDVDEAHWPQHLPRIF